MAILPFSRRQLGLGAGALAASSVLGAWFWPDSTLGGAYPLMRRMGDRVDPLWSISPEALLDSTTADAARLERLLPRLEEATRQLETLDSRLVAARVGELSVADRDLLRERWWQVFEPILAIDELKSRYSGWYGLDYFRYAKLHARSFALSFSALCAQVDCGLRLLQALDGKPLLPVLFDEAMPKLGLPARTFSGLRHQLGRARDLFLVPLGDEWYQRWISPHLILDEKLTPLVKQLDPLRSRARARVLTPTADGVRNKLDRVKGVLFERWFPLQKNMAEWAGDTRVAPLERRLVSDEQLAAFKRELRPGDIILERRNWYLSNIGLPGFWPHAALYVGSPPAIIEALETDPEVRAHYGNLSQHFTKSFPKAWAALGARDAKGHEPCVLEAVSEGVCAATLEHSCAADYVAALRPQVSPLMRARAIERALGYWGRPYDFNFDFATDDQVVCSELVVKAYESSPDLPGLNVPYVEMVGRRAVPPTEIVKHFRDHREQLEFVYFLEGHEKEQQAVVANAEALAATVDRPKWDIVKP